MENSRAIVIEPGLPDPCAKCDAREHSMCNSLDERDLFRLAEIAGVQKFEPGQTIAEEGEAASHFFNITSGSARLCKLLPDGRRQIIGFPTRGHFLGLAVTNTYGFSVEAITEVRLCKFSRAKLSRVISDFPELEAKLLQTAMHELVVAQEQMLLLGRKTARERLASFLISELTTQEACAASKNHLHLPMTRSDIADYLGLTIETVSRSFSKLKADRLISISNAADIGILDRHRLTAIANGET